MTWLNICKFLCSYVFLYEKNILFIAVVVFNAFYPNSAAHWDK